QYMLADAERLQHSEGSLLFTQKEFPCVEPLLLLEPRVALPKPTRYYQQALVDGKPLRCDWSAGSMRALAFRDGKIVFISKAVSKETGGAEALDHYFLAELAKEDVTVSERESSLTIAFDGKVEGINPRTRKPEQHALSFSFVHQHNEKAFVPEARVASSAVYSGALRVQSQQQLSRFENYSVTVMHFAPHPLLMQSYRELGFQSGLEFQKKVYDVLKAHLGR
ncbi:MAG: hypothetical protein N3H30_02095, partial [Candidatus Micrarchaeota archaeon]|nr:hypothetical protein [Candidatus Micrarchaeota archaeon]